MRVACPEGGDLQTRGKYPTFRQCQGNGGPQILSRSTHLPDVWVWSEVGTSDELAAHAAERSKRQKEADLSNQEHDASVQRLRVPDTSPEPLMGALRQIGWPLHRLPVC